MGTKPGIPVSELAARVGYSERQIRNFVKAGMPTLKGRPIRVDEQAARAWISANAAGATPGPGRPPADGEVRKPIGNTPVFIEDPLQELVLSGAGTPGDILRLAARTPEKGGISRAVAENLRTLASASSAVMELRKSSGQLLSAADVETTWKKFAATLAHALERLPDRAADSVLAALSLKPADKPKVVKALAKVIEAFKTQIGGAAELSGDDDEQEDQA